MNTIKTKKLATVALVVLLSFELSACTSWSRQEIPQSSPAFLIGYWNSFLGYELSFHSDGHIQYRSSSKSRSLKMSSSEQGQVFAFLASEEFQEALAWLREREYRLGCCDLPEVGLVYQDESLGYPVCSDTPLPSQVESFVEMVNEVASHHLGRQFVELPVMTCR